MPRPSKSWAARRPGFRGRIVCANGQLVHLAAGDRPAVIVSTIPVVQGVVGYYPVVQVPNVGVVAELRPTVVHGNRAATLDVRSLVTRWAKPQATVYVSAAAPVQRPIMPAEQLATTVACR